MSEQPVLGVLVSGTGRHLENLARLCAAGELDARLGLVVASRAGIAALERAQRARVEARVIDAQRELSAAELGQAVFGALEQAGCDTAVLAGWLRHLMIPPAWSGRVLNIHPSLLPAFGGQGYYGDRVHRAVLERGCKLSGCTVHYVDDEYDHGPILVQRAVPVEDDDDVHSLAARVFESELEAYPEALRLHFARGQGA